MILYRELRFGLTGQIILQYYLAQSLIFILLIYKKIL